MQLTIKTPRNTEAGKKTLPAQFTEPVRPDLIKRAVHAIQNTKRQPYGADPRAGKKTSADLRKRRRKYRGSYGHGISRVPRKIMSRRGMQMIWIGAFAPGTVGGRRAHPPKPEKVFAQKINSRERKKAIRSALAATVNKTLVEKRGHKPPQAYPFIISKDFESMNKTKQVKEALKKLGLEEELKRASTTRVRAGRGKTRGRKHQKTTGPLIVVSGDCKLLKSAKNIAGITVLPVHKLNAETLAPGTTPGRLALFTEQAIDRMAKENLFAS